MAAEATGAILNRPACGGAPDWVWPATLSPAQLMGRVASAYDTNMRAVLQRVSSASVAVDSETIGRISRGLVVLVGVEAGDVDRDATVIAHKISGLRVFGDQDGRMNLSLADIDGSVLLISQFTLLADVRRGRRPSFVAAAEPALAKPLIELIAASLISAGIDVALGEFGATMDVHLVNAGPVTVTLEVRGGRVV